MKRSASFSKNLNALDVSALDRCFPEDSACLRNSLVHNRRSAWWTSKGGTQGWFENPQSPLCFHVSSCRITIIGQHVGSQQKAQNDIITSHHLTSRGIMANMVLCVIPGQGNSKILNLVKSGSFDSPIFLYIPNDEKTSTGHLIWPQPFIWQPFLEISCPGMTLWI